MSRRYKGAIISATPPTTSTTSASGEWTLQSQAQAQGAGTWPFGGPFNYIENVFSTYLYTGNDTTNNIVNGIDLSTYGGLVWIKARSNAFGHNLYDTARTRSYKLSSNSTAAQTGPSGVSNDLTSFNTTGFSLGVEQYSNTNLSPNTYASWTFRKQPKFFDVVTYTGDGVLSHEVPHNLQSVPGCIIWKRTDSTSDWGVWHIASGITTSKTGGSLNATNAFLYTLNATTYQSATTFQPAWVNDAAGNNGNINGATYVAYLFAHNAGGFGLTNSDNVISCGSYTGTGAVGLAVTLGYEPQWVMVKASSTTGSWYLFDNMRGMTANSGANTNTLNANTSNAETANSDGIAPSATGFTLTSTSTVLNGSGSTYIYIAIRRGPMKVPTDATTVFSPIARTGTSANAVITTPNFVVDSTWIQQRQSGWQASKFFDRLRGATNLLYSNTTSAEVSDAYTLTSFASNVGFSLGSDVNNYSVNTSPNTYINYAFQRAPSFFDEVCYTGTGTTPQNVNHNLGVVPELIFFKSRSVVGNWQVFSQMTSSGVNRSYLNLTNAAGAYLWTDGIGLSSQPTSTLMAMDNSSANIHTSGVTYVSYLFATCAGVSKVGSYSGTGATQTIACGFTGGARFVLVKRTDTTGDWYVWDTARGMVSGTDPSLLLNSTAAEVNANSIYTTTGGFQIVSTAAGINASGGSYIFLAIA